MKFVSSILHVGLAGFFLSGTWLHATLIFDNLGTPTTSSPATSGIWWGQSFLVGADNYALTSVVMNMALANNSSGNFFVRIYGADGAGNAPGTILATLSGNANPSTAANYTYTPAATVDLSANTSYYVVAGVNGGFGSYRWNSGTGGIETGSAPNGYFNSINQGGAWNGPSTDRTFNMQVNAELTPIPEPVNVALGIFGALFGGMQSFRWWNARKAKASHV